MKQILLTMFTALMMSLSCANVQGQTFSKMPEKQRNAALIKAAKEFYKNPAFKNHRKTWPSVGETSIRQFYTQDSVSRMTAYHNIGTLQYEVIFWGKQTRPKFRPTAAKIRISDKLGKAYYCQFPDNFIWTIWNIYLLEKGKNKKK